MVATARPGRPAIQLIAAGAIALLASSLPAAAAIGLQEIEIAGDAGAEPLAVSLWYPATAAGTPVLVGDNPVFVGLEVLPEATPAGNGLPLAILSHGFGGHRGNLAWLAAPLVEAGHVVAALDHPGTTTRDMRAGEPMALAGRAGQISRLIDALSSEAVGDLAPGLLDGERIAVIGHSLGAWTALQLAGAQFSLERALDDCRERPELAACEVLAWSGAADDPTAAAALGRAQRDDRVGAVVALDIGMARGFTPASLAAIEVPVLVIAAGAPNPRIPAEHESGHLAAHLPAATTTVIELADAGHFSFMPRCKPGAVALLEVEEPGDEIVCLDADGGQREALHTAIGQAITGLLEAALGPVASER
jgi:predicted dienelactone hydrolase